MKKWSALRYGLLLSLALQASALAGGAGEPTHSEIRVIGNEVLFFSQNHVMRHETLPLGTVAGQVSDGKTLIVVGTGPATSGEDTIVLAYDVRSGKLLWRDQRDGQPGPPIIFPSAAAVAVNTASSRAAIKSYHALYLLRTGQQFNIENGYSPKSSSGKFIVFEYNPETFLADVTPEYSDASRVYLGILDTKFNDFTSRVLSVPVRMGCKNIDFTGNYRDDRRWQGSYLVIKRKDSCGVYNVRFDWTSNKPSGQIIR